MQNTCGADGRDKKHHRIIDEKCLQLKQQRDFFVVSFLIILKGVKVKKAWHTKAIVNSIYNQINSTQTIFFKMIFVSIHSRLAKENQCV